VCDSRHLTSSLEEMMMLSSAEFGIASLGLMHRVSVVSGSMFRPETCYLALFSLFSGSLKINVHVGSKEVASACCNIRSTLLLNDHLIIVMYLCCM
jgi:hypothetical protein